MLQKVRDASVRLGDVMGSDDTRLDVRLTAGSQQDADSMRALLQGVTAYGKYLAGQKNADTPAWAPLAAASRVAGTGREVRLTAEMSTRELMAVAAAAAKERARAEESAANGRQ